MVWVLGTLVVLQTLAILVLLDRWLRTVAMVGHLESEVMFFESLLGKDSDETNAVDS